MSEPQKKKQAPPNSPPRPPQYQHKGFGPPEVITHARVGEMYKDLRSGHRYQLQANSEWIRITQLVIDPLSYAAKQSWGEAATRAKLGLVPWIIQTLNKAARDEVL